jgi:uncharacterized protein YndB with AHSA1/START domain
MTVGKRLFYAATAIVALVLIIMGIGYALPQRHVASVQGIVSRPPADVFGKLSDVERYPEWRSDVEQVEVLSRNPLRWREHTGGDVITYEVVESDAPRRLVVRIADADLPFGGSWTYELRPEGSTTHLTITERGEVFDPFFRFMSRFVFGHTATMERVLTFLQA